MFDLNIQLLSIFVLVVFLSAILMHIVRRNSSLVLIYGLQSSAIVSILINLGIHNHSSSLTIVGLITLLVKVILAPIFFSKLIRNKKLSTSATTYLNLPITLGLILLLIIFVKSSILAPLISLFPSFSQLISLSLSGILISWLLVINRRGVFSQIIGILSFENGLVAFATLSGIEQTLTIELGILFDILLWIVVSSVLITLVFSHFGTFNTTEMNQLKD